MLIARQRGHRNLAAEDDRIEHADDTGAVHHAGQHGARNVQRAQQRIVPIVPVDVVEHRAAGVGRIRHMRTAGDEVPGEPAVHRAEAQLPTLRALMQVERIEQPAELAAGEVSVRHEARRRAYVRLKALVAQTLDDRRCAAALPHDRVVHRASGLPVPENRRLSLVGDADGGDVLHGNAADAHGLAQGVHLGVEDRRRVVLHPAGLRVDLLELVALHADDARLLIEDYRSGARRALIERDHILGHGYPSFHALCVQNTQSADAGIYPTTALCRFQICVTRCSRNTPCRRSCPRQPCCRTPPGRPEWRCQD